MCVKVPPFCLRRSSALFPLVSLGPSALGNFLGVLVGVSVVGE